MGQRVCQMVTSWAGRLAGVVWWQGGRVGTGARQRGYAGMLTVWCDGLARPSRRGQLVY